MYIEISFIFNHILLEYIIITIFIKSTNFLDESSMKLQMI